MLCFRQPIGHSELYVLCINNAYAIRHEEMNQ